LQSDQNLRGPHVARQQQPSIDICCPRPTSAANPPAAAAAAVDLRDRQTDGLTLDRESWTLRKNEETRLDAFEMKGLIKDSAGFVDSKENK